MRTITALPTVAVPTIAVQSLWHDAVDDINFRVTGITAIGIDVRCISNVTGNVWSDRLPRECFGTELTLVG